MLILVAAGRGGAGRSVIGANLAYRRALAGADVCWLGLGRDSATAAAVFEVAHAPRSDRIDVWADTEHPALRGRPSGSGRLVLIPGGAADSGDDPNRRADLLLALSGEFDLVMADLGAGHGPAVDLALRATARPEPIEARWLVLHRWTRAHVTAAARLAYGEHGIIAAGAGHGHDEAALRGAVRFVRTAVADPWSPVRAQASPAQSAWMGRLDGDLERLAARHGVGRGRVLGSVPLDPVLQWREQLITDEDVLDSRIAEERTWQALGELAARLADDTYWPEE